MQNAFQWTGLGCDVCGFGSVEDVDAFNPKKPCPDCGAVMTPETKHEASNCPACNGPCLSH